MPREVVERDKLVGVIDDFLRPFRRGQSEEGKNLAAAYEHLALTTGKTPETVARTIYRIKEENTSGFVLLTTAEWIVAVGMGRPDLFHTYLEVVAQESDRGGNGQLPQRKERPLVPPGVPSKKCRGPFCKGQLRPLSEFHFHKRGRNIGKPRSYCKECYSLKTRQYRQEWDARNPKYYSDYARERNIKNRKHKDWEHYGLVPYSKVSFALEELCKKLGPSATARMLGVSRSTVYNWRGHQFPQIRKEYAARILQSLWEVRNGNGSTK